MHRMIKLRLLGKAQARLVANTKGLFSGANLCERDPAGERGGHAAEDGQAECKRGRAKRQAQHHQRSQGSDE